jgi:hypothetical protein
MSRSTVTTWRVVPEFSSHTRCQRRRLDTVPCGELPTAAGARALRRRRS